MVNEKPDPEPINELDVSLKPIPLQSGSAGTQNQPPQSLGTEIVRQGHFGAVLGQFIDTRNPAALTLSIAAYKETIAKLWEVEQQRDSYRDKWNEESKQNAVFRDRQSRDKRQKWIFGTLNVFGGILITTGLREVVQNNSILNFYGLLLVFGLFLVSLVFIRRDE